MAEEQVKEAKKAKETKGTKQTKETKKTQTNKETEKWSSKVKNLGDDIMSLTLMQAKELAIISRTNMELSRLRAALLW